MWKLYIKIDSNTQMINQAVDLQDAFEKTFEYNKDKLFMEIGDKKLILPLVYTFSDLLSDFINIINDLITNKEGRGIYGFSQNELFDADWNFSWENENILLKINWLMINNKEDNSTTEIYLNRKEFLLSWKNLFISLSNFIDFHKINLEFNEENMIIIKLLDMFNSTDNV